MLQTTSPKLSKKELNPRGVHGHAINGLILIMFALTGLLLQNVVPASAFLMDLGVLSGSGMDVETRRNTIRQTLNIAMSISFFSTPMVQLVGAYAGGIRSLTLTWVTSHILGIFLISMCNSALALKAAAIFYALSFPASCLVFPPAMGLSSDHAGLLSGLNGIAGDLSLTLTGLITFVASSSGLSSRTTFYFYLVLLLPLATCLVLLTPKFGQTSYVKYISAQKYDKGIISYKEYSDVVEGKKKKGRPLGFNPTVDPLYHSYTLMKAICTKQMFLFLIFFSAHMLRVKKVVVPNLDIIFPAKAAAAGMTEAESDYVVRLFSYVLPALGFSSSLVYGIMADAIGNNMSMFLMNLFVSSAYLALDFLPLSKFTTYFYSVAFIINNGCCFGMGISFMYETFGSRIIGHLVAFFFLFMGLNGLMFDFVFQPMISAIASPVKVLNVTSFLSVIALSASVLLVFNPAPGPVKPEPISAMEVDMANMEETH